MKKILILGGDKRQLTVADEFQKYGYNPDVYCLDETNEKGIPDKLQYNYDIVISGLPTSRDGVYINAPLSQQKFRVTELTEILKPGGYFLGGMITPCIYEFCRENGFTVIDYFSREELIIKNIVPTVEGAVATAIMESPVTLNGSRCLVTGYGRIGKHLSKILKLLGAQVDVSARKTNDLTWIELNGYSPILTNSIKKHISQYDFIFNTVPAKIIDKECLSRVKKNALIMELASSPGGIDREYENKELRIISALSLPGRISPVTAGKIISETLMDIIETEVR